LELSIAAVGVLERERRGSIRRFAHRVIELRL
jgi:hypothetical protein